MIGVSSVLTFLLGTEAPDPDASSPAEATVDAVRFFSFGQRGFVFFFFTCTTEPVSESDEEEELDDEEIGASLLAVSVTASLLAPLAGSHDPSAS